MEETSLILRIISKYLHAVRDPENVIADDTSLWRAVFSLSQNETSEMFIGEWAEARGIRDQLFIATKVGIFLLNSNSGKFDA